jgi:predicted ATP-dependent endonuclease of OLD family
MLIELRCNKLIKNKLEFNEGLNALIGPDDGANSIGKSSVLMLIDFAFSGDDFIKLSSDIIDNVGIISIEMDFSFESIIYKFSRATNDPSVVTFITESERIEKPISVYRDFLKYNYKFPIDSASFRSAVNPFFRIWGKDNNNPNKPLNSFPSEPYSSIKPNLLKLFSLHSALKELEREKKTTQNKKDILKGAFTEGYIKPLTKKEYEKCEKRLEEVDLEITKIKKSI